MMQKILPNLCLTLIVACGGSTSSNFNDLPDSGVIGPDAFVQPGPDAAEEADAGEVVCWEFDPEEMLTDPDNCGTCGHSCLGGACVNGFCERTQLALTGDPIGSFSAGPLYVGYATEDAGTWSLWSVLNNGSSTQLLSGDRTDEMPDPMDIANEALYWTINLGEGGARVLELQLDGSGNAIVATSTEGVTGASTLAGPDLYWFAIDGTIRKTTIGVGAEDTLSFGHDAASSARNSGTNLFYWSGAGLISTPLAPADPFNPTKVTLTTDTKPTDWAIGNGKAYWHDGSVLRAVSTAGGSATTFSAEATGAVATEPGVVYVAEFDGNDDFIRAYSPDGTHLADVAIFEKYVHNGTCNNYTRPVRIEFANSQLYVSTERITECGLPLMYYLYRLPPL